MKFHEEQLRIVKGMILNYQQEPSEKLFLQILERVDKMLTEIIVKLSRVYHFQKSQIQDLYQSGIVGLKHAIDAFDPKAEEKYIPACIYCWVRKEIFETYKIEKFDVAKYFYEHPCMSKPDINSGLIQEDIQNIIEETINSGKLSEEDMCLIVLIHIENMTIKDIFKIFGKRWGGSYATINKKVEKISRILKREFEKKGFGSD